jgi:hypothetical protein
MTLHDTDSELLRGGADAPEPRRPPTPGGISMRPAMVVLGLAAFILVVFVTIGILSSQSPAPVRHGGAPSSVPGVTLQAEAAAPALSPIVSSGEPPTNIRNAVFVPVGSVRVSHQNNAAEAAQFDSQVVFRSDDSQAALLAFFAADMRLQGWQVFDRGPAANHPGSLEILGKLAGTDGYYWEMGAVISPTTFSPGGPPRGQTDFTIRLLQESDDAP